MGIVYRAEDPSIGRTVAIKTIRLADASSDRERKFLRDRLFREARSAGILSHPGIVTIYDIQEQGDYCYVFMEYVDGASLEKILHDSPPLTPHQMLDVLEQAAAALDYAHGKGIVHRDIKPANLMLAVNGTVKITDFGVAKFTSQQATNTGVLLGTPSYMSPEQISDRPVAGASDQFSLAVIAYLLLTGDRPFAGATLPSLMYKIVNEEPVPATRINPTIGPAVDVVLRKALHKQASERYPNCIQFVRALRSACEARPAWKPMAAGSIESLETVAADIEPMVLAGHTPLPEPTPETAPPPPPKRSRLWIAALVLVAAAAGAFALLRTWKTAPVPVAEQPEPTSPDQDTRPSAMGPARRLPPPETPPTEATATGQDPAKPAEPPPAEASSTSEPPPAREQARVETRPQPPKTPPDTPAVESTVRVVSSPPGAKILIDGRAGAICTAPCAVPLAAGRHTLAAMLDGYRTQARIFNTPADTEIILVLERSYGTVMVRSTPAGAAIFVDGVERRERTPAYLTLPAGRHKIAIVREGRREEQDVDVKDGAVTNFDVSWQQ